MPTLRVRTDGRDTRVEYSPGRTLRDLLHDHHVVTLSSCGGVGACGQCQVRVAGEAGAVTGPERARLSPADVEGGVRLACQVWPASDLLVTLDAAGPTFQWRELAPTRTSAPWGVAAPSWCTPAAPCGVAVDLGTTHLRLSLWNVSEGRLLTGRWALNPQAVFGADVLSRVAAAHESERLAAELRRVAREALGAGIRDAAAAHGVALETIGRVVIVGNTAMLTLLAGTTPGLLLDPATWMQPVRCELPDGDALGQQWGLPSSADVRLVQPLAGFVGSDLVAAVVQARLCEGAHPALLIDFGTNSEVGLWDGQTLWATSAAGGPAFEGCGTGCAMPAVPGAIRRATLERAAPPRFRCDVIGGGPGEGLAGSAMVDVIASLVEAGALTRAGNFVGHGRPQQLTVQESPAIVLTRRDVDAFQRAKAAIGAAAEALSEHAGIPLGTLRRVCLCGAFGEYLQAPHAQAIGLIPAVDPACVELHGHAALAGAERLLCAEDLAATVHALALRSRVLNLGHDDAYETRFIEHLRLRPMSSRGTL